MEVKTYKYTTTAWIFFLLLTLSIVAIWIYNGANQDRIFLLLVFVLPGLLYSYSLYIFRLSLFEDKLERRGLIFSDTVYFPDIKRIDIAASIDAISVDAGGGGVFRSDISVHYGVWGWPELAEEIVRRIPPDVEVHDPTGVVEDVEQGELWEGEAE